MNKPKNKAIIIENVSSRELYIRGQEFYKRRLFYEAFKYFEASFEKDPNNMDACFSLFVHYACAKRYEEAIKYFEILYKEEPFNKDYNFYLFLLNYLAEDVPKGLNCLAREVSLHSCTYENREGNPDIQQINDVRENVLKHRFMYARGIFNSYLRSVSERTESIILTDLLLKESVFKNVCERDTVVSLATGRNIEGLIDYLEKLGKNYRLDPYNEYLLKVARAYKEIDTTGKLPIVKRAGDKKNMFSAIDANDFALAEAVCSKYLNKKSAFKVDPSMSALLWSINELIEYTSSNLAEEYKQKLDNPNAVFTFDDVYTAIRISDFTNVFRVLRLYLRSIDQEIYTPFIARLIQEAVMQKSRTYHHSLIALREISNGVVYLDRNKYYRRFECAVEHFDLRRAEVYLGILKDSRVIDKGTIKKLEKKYAEGKERLSEVPFSALDETSSDLEQEISSSVIEAEAILTPIGSHYGIPGLDEIFDLIEEGIPVDQVFKLLKCNTEQKSITLLILAKEAYVIGDNTLGDSYLRTVERVKNKTPIVKSSLAYLRENKRFLRFREQNETKKYIISPIPINK